MTGNVAQVFARDEELIATLTEVRACLRGSGHLVFETPDPGRRGGEWTTEKTRCTVDITGVGRVGYDVDLLDVSLPFVTCRATTKRSGQPWPL